MQGEPKKSSNKQFNWGKSKEQSTAGFSGRVNDAFISGCSLVTEADVIKNSLIGKGIKVKNVELKSKDVAKTRSFKVSVETHEDFEKLISGEFIPTNVKVSKFIYYRTYSGKNSGLRAPAGPVQSTAVNNALELAREIVAGTTPDRARTLSTNSNSGHTINNILQSRSLPMQESEGSVS